MEEQKHFHLVRYFAFITAPLILICIIVAASTHRSAMLNDLEKMGELANLTLGQTLANTYSEQLKSIQGLHPSQKDADAYTSKMISDLLDLPVKAFLADTPVLRVKIFTPSGKTIYSTNHQQLSKTEELEREALTAARQGHTLSEMQLHENFVKNDGSAEKLMIVNTYMPIKDGNELIGILELYNNISSAYFEVRNGLHLFIAILFILGLLFFYTVIYFVQKAEKIIAERREEEQRDHEYLKVAFDKATESAKAKSEFLANMSHELRTPLNAIIGYSEILMEDNPDNQSAQNDLAHIKGAGIHLKTLIEEILDHAKIESGVIDLKTKDCWLNNIIDSCVSYIAPDASNNNNTIHVEHDKNINKLNTDETKIKRIILNLLSNANKFTKNGTVTISSYIKDGNVHVKVSDTGMGIPKDQFHKIFEPFTQIDNSYTRQHGGTGLGLTISREYARALEGDLTIESTEGKGTTAELRFPYCEAESNHIKDREKKQSPAA